MTRKGYKKRLFSPFGALMFFVLIAFIIQVAVLVYDYISSKTDNTALIAVLILIVVVILASICTVADMIRRKYMVDRPVARILAATEKIAAGDFSVRIDTEHPYGKYDEYDIIAENLNTMTEELRKSEILKSDFISNVSHELKTPIAVMRGYASAMREGGLSESEYREYSASVYEASVRLGELVDNILKLNKLENQALDLEYEQINLTSMLSEAVLRYEHLIEKKGIELECELDDVTVTSVPSYLEIIWNNLISNALKFTENGGKVSIRLSSSGNDAVVSVSDTGCGISKEVGERMFEKFYQGDTSHASEGNGLGLALVKRVIDSIGGEISVSSTVGVGTTFTVTVKNQ